MTTDQPHEHDTKLQQTTHTPNALSPARLVLDYGADHFQDQRPVAQVARARSTRTHPVSETVPAEAAPHAPAADQRGPHFLGAGRAH